MLKITDEIINSKKSDSHELRAGQIELQFWIEEEILRKEQVLDYLMNACQTYVQQAEKQSKSGAPQRKDGSWKTKMTSMWVNSQYDNEYFPIHIHTKAIAAVIYLKIPEILPSRQIYERNNGMQDGCIEFINYTSTDNIWTYACFYS